jgi:hypothetical protein
MVVVRAGRRQGVLEQTVFVAERVIVDSESTKTWVETGQLKALKVSEDETLAAVIAEESDLSRAYFPKFPGVMAGDMVREARVTIARNQEILPTFTITYAKTFEDPKALPATFEMSSTGKEQIRAMMQGFSTAHLPLLMVEGYTDSSGPEDANQVESYQRALTVRQFLVDELGFDPSRVVAIGYGESEPIGETYAPGSKEKNRRIVVKAKSMGSQPN